MDPTGELFPLPSPEADAADETLSVRQVAERLQALLDAGFPTPFWLVGETSNLEQTVRQAARAHSKGHWYFQLVDEEAGDAQRASLNLVVWRSTVTKLFGRRGSLQRDVQPVDGIVLRMLVRPDFYPPRGQISFIVDDIDPEYTLGSLDRQRRELVARLQAEGVPEWNKARLLPDVPLRLGLITSEGSAAQQDVLQTLRQSGLGFLVVCCDARTQGVETGPSVRRALATLAARDLDAILLVRGGGSRLDLSWFDQEDLARAVAGCPLPVLTGIGHEIDTSVADLVAHTSFKTPTAAAEFLVGRAREAARGLQDGFDRILRAAHERLMAEQGELTEGEGRLRRSLAAGVREAAQGVATHRRRLGQAVHAALETPRSILERLRDRLRFGTHVSRLDGLSVQLADVPARLERQVRVLCEHQLAALESAARRLRLLDPRSVLARGYAYLRREDGAIVKDVAAVGRDEALTAVLRDGELDMTVQRARPAARETSSVEAP